MVPQQAHYQFRWLKSVSSTLGLVHLQFAVCYLLFHRILRLQLAYRLSAVPGADGVPGVYL